MAGMGKREIRAKSGLAGTDSDDVEGRWGSFTATPLRCVCSASHLGSFLSPASFNPVVISSSASFFFFFFFSPSSIFSSIHPTSIPIHPNSSNSFSLRSFLTPVTPLSSRIVRPLHCSSAAMSGVNKACCSIPPIVAQGYQGKGEYKTINGLKTYVTGPESATKAILVIYDIFGFFPQTIQGADILATASEQKYRVFIPDFFQGEPADITWFPPQTDDHKQKLGNSSRPRLLPPQTCPRSPPLSPRPTSLLLAAASSPGRSWVTAGEARSRPWRLVRITSCSRRRCNATRRCSTPTMPRVSTFRWPCWPPRTRTLRMWRRSVPT
ncbi:uncharacterized protein An12g09130 [Aspergillus niger]|uniref:Contig An12c0310, genomic contig n=2 Tax=Aspergillus niger TaxID=5061 RepID=A2R0M6_ASPNC|nr:uncharacterized protein An12g09130 [Aspergillus niger]CAK46400.1 unnamed protein product [Aspergillus niger]